MNLFSMFHKTPYSSFSWRMRLETHRIFFQSLHRRLIQKRIRICADQFTVVVNRIECIYAIANENS